MAHNTVVSGTNNTSRGWWTVRDGLAASTVMQKTATSKTASQQLVESEAGYSGKAPVPARLDHSHPLNTPNVVVGGSTLDASNNPEDFFKSGVFARFGTSPYYPRIDHVHPVDKTQGKKKISSSASGLKTGGRLTTTWATGTTEETAVGCSILVVSRITRQSDYVRRIYLREAQIGRCGNIISLGAESGYVDSVINDV